MPTFEIPRRLEPLLIRVCFQVQTMGLPPGVGGSFLSGIIYGNMPELHHLPLAEASEAISEAVSRWQVKDGRNEWPEELS